VAITCRLVSFYVNPALLHDCLKILLLKKHVEHFSYWLNSLTTGVRYRARAEGILCLSVLVWPFLPTRCSCRGLLLHLITLEGHTHSIRLLWTRDWPLTETSMWHTTLTTNRYPCLQRDSNPQSQQASGRRPIDLGRAATGIGREFSLHQNVETVSGAHLSQCPITSGYCESLSSRVNRPGLVASRTNLLLWEPKFRKDWIYTSTRSGVVMDFTANSLPLTAEEIENWELSVTRLTSYICWKPLGTRDFKISEIWNASVVKCQLHSLPSWRPHVTPSFPVNVASVVTR
jgi:hypothetical protein